MANTSIKIVRGITLKNRSQNIKSILDIPDVDAVEVVDGAIITYNAASEKYEVRLQDSSSAVAAGANGYVQYNSSDVHAGSNGLIFTASSNTLTVGSASINSTSFSGTANNALYLGGVSAAGIDENIVASGADAYANAIAYASNAAHLTSNTVSPARLPQATAVSNGAVMILDSVTNTSIEIYAVAANSVKTAYDTALLANTRASSAQTAAVSAYANAISFASNADNIASGTLNTARLPSTANISTAINVGANVALNTSAYFVGNTTANVFISQSGLYLANSTSETHILIPEAAIYSATNYFLHANGSWIQVSAGGGTPGGANTYIQFNDSGAFNGSTGFTFNSTTNNVTVANTITVGGTVLNSTTFAGTSNNSLYLGGVAAADYQTEAGLSANVAALAANVATYVSGSGTIFVGNTTANVTANSIMFAVTNATSSVVMTPSSVAVGNSVANINANTTVLFIGNSTVSIAVNSTSFSGTANDTLYLGGVAAADYQTEAGLSANVATMTSNNSLYLGGTPAAGYQTTAGLAANVATMTTNAAVFVIGDGTIFMGNTTANIWANSIVLTVANSTSSSNQTPAGFFVGGASVNSTVIGVGANSLINTTAMFVGNSTVNTYVLQTGLFMANSTSNTHLQVPTVAEWAATNYFLHANGAWVQPGETSPGGSNTYIQYNDSGAFNGTAGFTYDETTNNVAIANTLMIGGAVLNSTSYAGTANNALYLGGVSLATLQGTITANGDAAYSNAVTILAPKANPTFSGVLTAADAVINGNLTVSGTTTYINSTTLNVGDNMVTLNADLSGATAPTENAGIEVNRGSAGNVQFMWDETVNRWSANDQWLSSNGILLGNSTIFSTANSTVYSGTSLLANNSAFLGGVAAADYQTEAGLSSNVSTLAANAATYVVGNGTISVGNTTANIWANSVILTVANSTVSTNVGPGGLVVGITTANATMISVGANNLANATASFIGNSTVNTYFNQDGIYLANSTSNTKVLVPSAAIYSATNYFLHANGSWVQVSAGGGTPGGANTYIQFNDSSTFSGSAGFTFDVTTNNVTVANTITVGGTVLNSTTFAGTSNNALFLGGVAAADYQTEAGLSANVAVLAANVAEFVSGNGTVFVGNTTANIAANSIQFAVTNSTSNVVITPLTVSVGNSVANAFANSILIRVANSTAIANLTPISMVVGTVTQNTTGFFAGSNVIVNASGFTIGNSTVNAAANSTSILLSGGGYVSTGGLDVGYVAKTANYTLTGTDYFVSCSTGTASFTATLPTAVGRTGQVYTIKKTDGGANTVTVATTSSQTIDGVTTRVLANKNDAIVVVSDNANWQVVSRPAIIPVGSANTASPFAWNSDLYNHYYITGQGVALTINADAGSPVERQTMTFRIKDDGTARALTWTIGTTNSFRAIGTSLPTTTVSGKTVYVGCIYNSTDSRWDVVSVAQEA